MTPRLDGQTAIVTGAGSGIGRGIAIGFAQEGAQVVLAGRDHRRLAETAAVIDDLGGESLIQVTDVTSESEVERLFQASLAWSDRLDLLVNNAGAFDGGPIDELSVEAWDHVLAVNLRGPFLCARAAFKIMKRQRRGRIINIGSISAQRVRPGSAAYSTSKHGLWGLTQVLALEGRGHGITCGCIHPGNVAVERRATGRDEDQEPMMNPADIASVAVLMASLPPHVEMLESIVLPSEQLYVGRG